MNLHPETPGPAIVPRLPAAASGLAGKPAKLRRIFRFVNWSISRNPDAAHTVYVNTCLWCSEECAGDKPEGPQDWAIRHAVATGHRKFSEDMRTFWIVHPSSIPEGPE